MVHFDTAKLVEYFFLRTYSGRQAPLSTREDIDIYIPILSS